MYTKNPSAMKNQIYCNNMRCSSFISLNLSRTNPRNQIAQATEFCMVVPNICRSSVQICFMSLINTQSSGMAFWKFLHPCSELSSLSNTIPEHIHSVVRSWHEPTNPVAVEVWLLTFYQDTATKVPYFNTSRNAGTLRRSPIPQY